MIRKAWYAVCQGDSVREQPIKVTVHGQDFVIFRDSQGTLHAFHAYCPHRGCDLSLGTWDHEELQCPFHGWRFNTKGACVHIPANLRGSRAPARSALPSYPVAEHAALVWIYTLPHVEDTQSMPEFVTFPELNQPEWAVSFFDVTWQAHFTRVVESVLDVSHLPFVHPDTTGDVVPVVDGPECSVRDSGIKIHPSPFAPAHPMQPIHSMEGISAKTEIELLFPNQWMIRTPVDEGNWMCTFLTFTPHSNQVTHIFGLVMRNFNVNFPLLDEFHLAHTKFVLAQDERIIESLRPRQAPFDLHLEAHVPSDLPTLHYRKLLKFALQQEHK